MEPNLTILSKILFSEEKSNFLPQRLEDVERLRDETYKIIPWYSK